MGGGVHLLECTVLAVYPLDLTKACVRRQQGGGGGGSGGRWEWFLQVAVGEGGVGARKLTPQHQQQQQQQQQRQPLKALPLQLRGDDASVFLGMVPPGDLALPQHRSAVARLASLLDGLKRGGVSRFLVKGEEGVFCIGQGVTLL